MSDSNHLQRLLHSPGVPRHHRVEVGRELDIEMPRMPMTGDTEFVELRADVSGARETLDLEPPTSTVEGRLLPRSLHAHATHPGRVVISISALDTLSRKPISTVEPLEIVVDVEEP